MVGELKCVCWVDLHVYKIKFLFGQEGVGLCGFRGNSQGALIFIKHLGASEGAW